MAEVERQTRLQTITPHLKSRRSARSIRMLRKRRATSLGRCRRHNRCGSSPRWCYSPPPPAAMPTRCSISGVPRRWESICGSLSAYLLIALSLILGLAALRTALGLWSPHAKLAIAGIALLACLTFGVGGGRFVSYTLRGTLNPPFKLKLHVNDRFPDFRLADQNDQSHDGDIFSASPRTLVVGLPRRLRPVCQVRVGRTLTNAGAVSQSRRTNRRAQRRPPATLHDAGALSPDSIAALSDPGESLLGPLGLVQHYANGQPDSAIPAFFLVDRNRRVKWIFTSPYYREQPATDHSERGASPDRLGCPDGIASETTVPIH